MSRKNEILQAMLTIANSGPDNPLLGICSNVIDLMEKKGVHALDMGVDTTLEELFQGWPDKSISLAYPVGNWSMQPSNLFWKHHDDGRSMWDPSTRYGKARWDLLNWSIEQLKKGY